MYIFVPAEQKQGENQSYNGFMDAVNIASLIIGLENMELNISASDLEKERDAILKDFHTYIDKLDKHLERQDQILAYQNSRLMRLEKYLYEKEVLAGKEKEK